MRSRNTLALAALVSLAPLAVAAIPAQDLEPPRPFAPLAEVRSIDGTGNHPTADDRGAALTPALRGLSVDYGDGVGSPAGADRPSARFVSSAALAQSADRPNALGVSDLFWQWGQFLDHDITETPIHAPAEPFPIVVPTGDPWFDPAGTGSVELPFSRSFPVRVDGRREQLNGITAWIDGSQVYGSDLERARALRTLDGTGRLRTSEGDLLPFNLAGLPNAPSDHAPNFFLAGDIRANEQVGLTALHVLFVREHNHWAARIAAEDRDWIRRRRAQLGLPLDADIAPAGGSRGGSGGGRGLTSGELERRRNGPLSGDQIYELARAIVTAELQRITYREWLPLLLGRDALASESVYRPELDAGIRNEFATAAFRIGHSMLSPRLLRIDGRGQPIAAGHLALADSFFTPETLIATGIDPLLRGLVTQRAQELDAYLIDDVRNFLFGPPGAGGLDLGALNLQRGRDHGLPSYAQARRDLGLGAPATLAEISSDPAVTERLQRAARSPEHLDLWVGGLAEDHVPGALVGPTFHAMLLEQFDALRDGDRLWHTRQLGAELLQLVEAQGMAQILERCSGLRADEAREPFLAR